jgi:hypothetical protein
MKISTQNNEELIFLYATQQPVFILCEIVGPAPEMISSGSE